MPKCPLQACLGRNSQRATVGWVRQRGAPRITPKKSPPHISPHSPGHIRGPNAQPLEGVEATERLKPKRRSGARAPSTFIPQMDITLNWQPKGDVSSTAPNKIVSQWSGCLSSFILAESKKPRTNVYSSRFVIEPINRSGALQNPPHLRCSPGC